jgi:uncharacterized damage-inducible protein DinB
MNELERRQKIEAYGNAYFQLCDAIREFPREMWQFKPADDNWSIQEILVHMADAEANAYVRFRKAIVEPGSAITVYDQTGWAGGLDYKNQNANDSLELFRWLRATTYGIFRTLPESAWQNTIQHPERGPMTLERMIDIYIVHIEKHIAQMRRVYDAWKASQPQNI